MAFFGNKLMTNPPYVSERGRVWTKTMRLKKWKCSKGCLERALYFEKYTKPLSSVTISSVFGYGSETYHSKWIRCMTPGHLNGWKTIVNGSKRWVRLCWIPFSLYFRDQGLLLRLLVLSPWLHSSSGRLCYNLINRVSYWTHPFKTTIQLFTLLNFLKKLSSQREVWQWRSMGAS